MAKKNVVLIKPVGPKASSGYPSKSYGTTNPATQIMSKGKYPSKKPKM